MNRRFIAWEWLWLLACLLIGVVVSLAIGLVAESEMNWLGRLGWAGVILSASSLGWRIGAVLYVASAVVRLTAWAFRTVRN
jgi:hypothetical protein